jgi:hypothetical protein
VGRTRRIEITVETEEVYAVRTPLPPRTLWCAACAAEVEMLTPEEAAAAAGTSARAIYRLVEAGLTHFAETPEGLLLVCPALLAAPRALPG